MQHVFDTVILDYGMPGINGIEVASEIIKINPQQRIIISSAYTREAIFDSIKELGKLIEFIQKPFDIQTLIDTLENKLFYSELERINKNADLGQEFNRFTNEQINDLSDVILRVRKSRLFG
jgi:two-component system, chemotaxis family, chemotaxis protein CheY